MLFLLPSGVFSTCSLLAEETEEAKSEDTDLLSCFASLGQPEGRRMGSHPLENVTNPNGSLMSQKLSALQSNSRPEPMVSARLERKRKKLSNCKCKTTPSLISAAGLTGTTDGIHKTSVSQDFSDPGLSSVQPPHPAFTVHSNEKLLPVTQSHVPCSLPVAWRPNPSQTNTAPTRATKHKPGRRRSLRGLKLAVKGTSLLSMRRKSRLQRRHNVKYQLGRKWRTLSFHFWASIVRAKREMRTRKLLMSIVTVKNAKAANAGERKGSQKLPEICEREVVSLDIGCNKPSLVSAAESQAKGSSDQKACPPVGTSAQCGNPGTEGVDCGVTSERRGVAPETNQAPLDTKRPPPLPLRSPWASRGICWETTRSLIYEFLHCFYVKYGSFIPLRKGDVLVHLNDKLNTDLTKWKPFISAEARELKAVVMRAPMPSFRVLYNKHTLGLEDLSTLDHQNWLNDQVMNMYGDLIMESAQHRVHFFNSFFHRQLMTKGYEGVRRWTRKVDLFSKSLLLVPIHLEIHWCLVTADTTTKRIHLYDSQGFDFKEAAENVLRYIMTEALEKKQPSFQSGWKIYLNELSVSPLGFCRVYHNRPMKTTVAFLS
ncbi:uncharacterized protein LOC105028929 isoform X2 [Esox lucius]|uniref:uncharacterized protein LOC105028929 isoform X2 n=1 Tax=Esox lucius TaxID=8010 RepID=UPI0014770E8F|nr:uncharacterized protein LOC105028929 isoform X2 [Esox lucius]